MNVDQFDDVVAKGKINLEILLYKKPAHKAIKDAWLNIQKEVKNRGGILKMQSHHTKVVETEIIGSDEPPKIKKSSYYIPFLRIFGLDGILLSYLSKYSGKWAYTSYHEIGELTYLHPIFTYIKSIGDLPSNEISELSASDIYGDLLASTLSPLTPEQQLELFGGKKFSEFSEKDFSKKELKFIESQAFGLEHYESRIKEGYTYGPELKQFYHDILELQLGFEKKKRAALQIKMYESVQGLIRKELQNCNELNAKKALQMIFYPKDILKDLLKSKK